MNLIFYSILLVMQQKEQRSRYLKLLSQLFCSTLSRQIICRGITYSQTSLNVDFLLRTALTIETCLGLDTKQLHQLLHDEFANLHHNDFMFSTHIQRILYMINGIKHEQKKTRGLLYQKKS